jgi:5-formyltetrahydrofolate cyclo-ligase
MDFPSSKQELRREWLKRREEMDAADLHTRSLQICRYVQDHPFYRCAQQLLFTMPLRNEVDLRPLMEAAWEEGKRVILPGTFPKERRLCLYRIEQGERLVLGSFGIMEPVRNTEREISPQAVDLALIPGVAFDPQGYRVGYGGGYFDRFFSGPGKDIPALGVAFAFQIVPTVYPEAHDIPLIGVVTEEGWVGKGM